MPLNGLSPWQTNPYRGFEIMKIARRAIAPSACTGSTQLRGSRWRAVNRDAAVRNALRG